jgi:uncharacterized repeat protein (TIGR03803 family)
MIPHLIFQYLYRVVPFGGSRTRNRSLKRRLLMTRAGQHLGPVSSTRTRWASVALVLAVVVLVVETQSAQAQTFTVLSNFTGSSGAYPYGGLMQDSAGTIYGTTYSGGSSSAGTMFALPCGAEARPAQLQRIRRIDSSWSIDRRQDWKSLWDWELVPTESERFGSWSHRSTRGPR